jgi:hypothetical protein
VVVRLPTESEGFLPSGTILSLPDGRGRTSFWGTNGRVLYRVTFGASAPPRVTVADPTQFGYGRLSGYWVMDRDNVVYAMDSDSQKVLAFSHQDPADVDSAIVLKRSFRVPADLVQKKPAATRVPSGLKERVMLSRDAMLGIELLYSGELCITTRFGKVMVLSRDFSRASVMDVGEPIDNSFVVDDQGGVYLSTFARVLRLQWDGSKLTKDWEVALEGRTGSTPTLMGGSDHPLIAITLGDQPMSLVLLWRRTIPDDWSALEGQPRRVAATVKVDYGGGDKQSRQTENSLLVYGNSVIAANWTGLWPRSSRPYRGLARYDWDPQRRTLERKWLNASMWLPNSMQGMSAATGLIYGIGVEGERSRQYGPYGVRFEGGEVAFFSPLGDYADRALNIVGSGIQVAPGRRIVTTSPFAAVIFEPSQ